MPEDEFVAKCHCGRVQGRFRIDTDEQLWAWDCDCSDCFMRGNLHLVVHESKFSTDLMSEPLEEATILYQWGTKIAQRRFCQTCGILPWYRPRSNPDSVGVTIRCVDWTKGGSCDAPHIEIKKFDGQHWEEFMAKLKADAS